MTTEIAPIAPRMFTPPGRFDNAEEWLHSLGDVPLHRVIFDPWPGTATEADLLRIVESGDRLCELVDGTLVEKPMGFFESKVAANLIVYLGAFVLKHDLGSIFGADSTLRMRSVNRIRLPDVSFVSKARVPKKYVKVPTLAPDLAVEVLSESNSKEEIRQKLREYFNSGTRLAWVIDPADRTVAVYRSPDEPAIILGIADSLDGEDVVPGFRLPVVDLFVGVPEMD